MGEPAFLITIDTEGDNLWARPREITTRNAAYLPRFQELCERYGFRPVYLTNWEMVHSDEFVAFGRDVLARGVGEIGMHLHAWNSPPLTPLGDDDFHALPYLIDYPKAVQREKIHVITGELEETFGCKMRSHRAGRWALNCDYVESLWAHGYSVDCSVTPHVVWRETSVGDEAHAVDYRRFPTAPYRMDVRDISRPAEGGLLEAPMTVLPAVGGHWPKLGREMLRPLPMGRRVADRLWPQVRWLRPSRHNRASLMDVLDAVRASGAPYAQFMLHSSEFMPGGSPIFPTERAVEQLYETLEMLFSRAREDFVGKTLAQFHDELPEQAREAAAQHREIA